MTQKLDEKNPFVVLLKSLTDTIVKLTQAMDGMNQRLLTLEEIHKNKQFTDKVNKNIDNMLDQ